MQVHGFDGATGEYTGTSEAERDPLDRARYLMPHNSTTVAPALAPEGWAQVWNGAAWSLVADYRGETWYRESGEAVVVEALGDPADAGLQPEAPPVALDVIKAGLRAKIDAQAEAERLRYVTPGAGQAMTYQAKADEARRIADDPDPDPAAYPLLAAEIGITAGDLAGVGAVVRANHAAWLTVGAAIEAVRLGTKAAVTAADDEAAAIEAATATWPSPPEHTP
jgi:hypothetical protein